MDFDSVVQIICARSGRSVMLGGCGTTCGGNDKQNGNEAMSFHARPSLGHVCRQSGHLFSYGQYLE